MTSTTLPYRKSCCGACPFLNLPKHLPCLGEQRAKEILEAESFVCHKNNSLQCAGHMMLMKKKNVFVRMASVLALPLELKDNKFLVKSEEEFINLHK